jgi:hypothetical protein
MLGSDFITTEMAMAAEGVDSRSTSGDARPWAGGQAGNHNSHYSGNNNRMNGSWFERGVGLGGGAFFATVRSKLPFSRDSRKQRWFIFGVLTGVFVLLALIIGLAVGLTLNKKYFHPFRSSTDA